MKRKQSANGLGFNSYNETAREASKYSYIKQLKTQEVSDAYHEYESKYSNLKELITFIEFKKIYNKRGKKGIDKVLQNKPIIVSENKTESVFKPRIRRVTKDGKVIERKDS
jgi:hypothetical protein